MGRKNQKRDDINEEREEKRTIQGEEPRSRIELETAGQQKPETSLHERRIQRHLQKRIETKFKPKDFVS
ncbi:MAG: hypothetical protein ABSG31_07435 [Tepidisphaeraceae bacterium]|jgi:hypothetical protein